LPASVSIDSHRPLLIVDVDEVLALFMRGFERYLADQGYEVRLTKWALFQNIFQPGATGCGRVIPREARRFSTSLKNRCS